MPSFLRYGQYTLYFWSAEGNEPVHIHVAIKRPIRHGTKFWLTADGGCYLASNGANIPKHELSDLQDFITFNHGVICDRWKATHGSLEFKK